MKTKQPWLANPLLESVFILSPALIPVILVLVFNDYFRTAEVSTAWWIILVLCIDVSHVYSTLFRLYWDKNTFHTYKKLLLIIPIAAFAVAFIVHAYDAMLFWRLLAYVAVFHFIRQQYGFMRLYSRHEKASPVYRLIDSCAIYSATIYPIVYWHLTGTDTIAWFIHGDFIHAEGKEYDWIFTSVYCLSITLYIIKEITFIIQNRSVNIPKNLIIAGTYASWYFGIVAFQGDLIFTLLNVVSHGIPYMALIWIYGEKKSAGQFSFGVKTVTVFIAVIFLLAYLEEGLWDNFVWKDHAAIFPSLVNTPIESHFLLSVIVAILILPQVTHYVLDGFIWRFRRDVKARL